MFAYPYIIIRYKPKFQTGGNVMSFDFDELKHKAGNMLEKGKEKAHEAA